MAIRAGEIGHKRKDARSWKQRGACAGHPNPDPVRGFNGNAARRICAGCEVQAECLNYALENDEPWVWGGMSEKKRRELLKQPGHALDTRRCKTMTDDDNGELPE